MVLFDQFRERAEAVSAEVHRFPTRAGALDFIIGFLQRERVADESHARAVWADHDWLDAEERKLLADKMPGLTFQVTRTTAAEARVGITRMQWALADTGTLAGDSTPVEERLASTLPPVHMALVGTDLILADMPSLLARIHPRESGYISMITGPSRTADIERVLTIGVHGPERLIIVFIDEPGERN